MKSALILFADGSEELEAITIVNILRRGGINVTLTGLHSGILRGSRGTMIQPDTTLDEVLKRDYDLIALPGGQPGTNNLKTDERVIALVQRMAKQGKYVSAICAAPSVLATAGLLDGKQATSFPGALDQFPKVARKNESTVEDGIFITSRGPGTAMDFSLLLLERLAGKQKRDEVEASLVR
jgi:4-methyl-5(b-hydroxyethyl)-thiazole monophosphate biosynthesis